MKLSGAGPRMHQVTGISFSLLASTRACIVKLPVSKVMWKKNMTPVFEASTAKIESESCDPSRPAMRSYSTARIYSTKDWR